MTSAPPKSIVFHLKSPEIDSIKWTTTRKLLIDLALLSKYFHNNYFHRLTGHSDVLQSKKVERSHFKGFDDSKMFTDSDHVMVKRASNYRASRLAHYQDQVTEDGCPRVRASRRSVVEGPLLGTTPLVLTEDYLNNNDHQRITSDDVPSNIQCNMTQLPIVTDSRTDNRRKQSGNDMAVNVMRSQSIGPTYNVNNMAVLTSIHNRSNPDTSELSPLGTRADSLTRPNPNSRACYFCWCCCCSCSCLNIKPKPEESLRTPISNEPQSKPDTQTTDERFTLEEAQKWAQNFDFLMQSSAGRKVFQEFLKLEYSEENIMFYKAVEDLQSETNVTLIEEKARSIYEDYISILSPKEVSLDSRVRDLINSDMVEPSSHTFDEAQLQIFTLMQRDSYPRFLNSRLYKDLLRQLGGSSTTSNSQTLFDSRPINNC